MRDATTTSLSVTVVIMRVPHLCCACTFASVVWAGLCECVHIPSRLQSTHPLPAYLPKGQKIKLIREETGALITTPGEHEEHVFIIEAPPSMAMRVARHLATRAQEITNSKSAAGERRRGSTSSQPNGGSDGGNGNNSAFLLTPNGGGGGCSGGGGGGGTVNILPSSSSLGHNNNGSATNSPLHPQSTSVSLMSFSGSALRPTNGNCAVGGLFTNNGGICSLPNSPSGGHNSVVVGGGPGCQTPQSHLVGGPTAFCSNSSSNSTNNTPGNRVLLARGRISVPQEMVGKIIGTQGSIITTIQKDTGTEIKSPPKEAARGPNATSEFEISAYQGVGLSSNQAAECRVQQAKQLIGHLVMRQLERRASEEVEEVASSSVILGGVGGGNSNGGVSEDQRGGYHHHNNNNNNHHHHSHHHPHHHQMAPQNVSNGGTSPRPTVNWMWPDVAKMDSQEAREVLDRILAESKNKTRRAKELAVAAGGGGCGTSPTSVSILTNHNHSNPSMMNGCCDGAGSQLHPPPPPQLLGQHPSLYDVLGVDGAGDCTGGIGDPYSGSPYGGGRNGFVDDLSSNSAAGLNGSINHLCSPRTPHGECVCVSFDVFSV